MTEHPVITVSEDFDTGEFILLSTAYNMTAPAGPRLFRAPPWPEIRFRHDSREQAEKDAAALQQYVEAVWPKRTESKAALRKKKESRA
jgi:hypothetical protein